MCNCSTGCLTSVIWGEWGAGQRLTEAAQTELPKTSVDVLWIFPACWPRLSSISRNEARELWLKLKAQGWKQVDPQWGVDVDV